MTIEIVDQSAACLAEIEAEEKANAMWRPSTREDDPRNVFDMKLYQVEMLAHSLIGDGFEAFKNKHDRIQEGVLWTIAELITEAREALEASESK